MSSGPENQAPGAAERANDPHQRGLLVLAADDIAGLLAGRERDLVAVAAHAVRTVGTEQRLQGTLRQAPAAHDHFTAQACWSSHAPAAAGLLWTSTFVGNADIGLPRSSAMVLLNDPRTGRPRAALEGTLLFSQRTAALTSLAVCTLHQQERIGLLGIFGCGMMGREALRFILCDKRPVEAVLLYDTNLVYSRMLADALRRGGFPGAVSVASTRKELIENADVLVFSTAATRPTLDSLAHAPRHSTLIHLSLRDLTANAVLQADNLSDDIELLLSAPTSVQRTFQLTGRRDFLRASLADVLNGVARARAGAQPVVFHLCGQPAVDVALAEWVTREARLAGLGTLIPNFSV